MRDPQRDCNQDFTRITTDEMAAINGGGWLGAVTGAIVGGVVGAFVPAVGGPIGGGIFGAMAGDVLEAKLRKWF